MVQLSDDVDGCGCLRCQGVDHEVVRRSLAGALAWSVALPFRHPSILVVLGAIGLLQAGSYFAPRWVSLVLILFGIIGVFAGRGYIGVVGRSSLTDESVTPGPALAVVARRLPSFLGASIAIVSSLFALWAFVVVVLSPGMERFATLAGTDPLLADFAILFLLVALVVYVLLKCCFVPEACFIGEYGPLESIRVSWAITSVHTSKAVLILAGFAALLAVGVVLDTQLAGTGAPVTLSFEIGETTVVLRSFGLSLASSARFGFDMAVTALYSGLFVHQYVDSTVTAQ